MGVIRNIEEQLEQLYSGNPRVLYRGMRFKGDDYKTYRFTGDIPLPDKFIINEDGLKCVTDGNEYGIYMSSSREMAANYATPSGHDVTSIDNTVYVGVERLPIGMPSVGVLMSVDTEGLDIKEPYICPQMAGHYNNGYQGKEWISTQPIPINNISYDTVVIGPDALYDAVTFDNVGASAVRSCVTQEMDKRQKSLMALHDFLSKESSTDLLRMNYKLCKDSFRALFVDKCLEKTDFDMTSKDGLRDMMLCSLNEQHGGLNLKDVIKVSRDINRLTDEDILNKTPKFEKIMETYAGGANVAKQMQLIEGMADGVVQSGDITGREIVE